MLIKKICFFCKFGSIFLALLFSNTSNAFVMLEALNLTNKPNFKKYGFDEVYVVYQYELWAKGEDLEKLPNEYRIELSTQRIKTNKPKYVVLDVEHWPVRKSNVKTQESVEKYLKVLTSYKARLPDYRIGYYRLVPNIDVSRAIKGKNSELYKSWQRANNRMAPLADKVDILYPSLYTFTEDVNTWKKFATAQIREARRLAKGREVICFLWPRYHNSRKIIGGKSIPRNFWRAQLELVFEQADGFVIWEGKKDPWDENAEWWQETKEFIKSKYPDITIANNKLK